MPTLRASISAVSTPKRWQMPRLPSVQSSSTTRMLTGIGQAGGRLEGEEAVGEEAFFVVGGYDHPDLADRGWSLRISPVREATERWSWLQTASRKSARS